MDFVIKEAFGTVLLVKICYICATTMLSNTISLVIAFHLLIDIVQRVLGCQIQKTA